MEMGKPLCARLNHLNLDISINGQRPVDQMTASREEVLLAYRHLYKGLLRAVQYSMPARLLARERVRNAFRKSTAADYDAASIERTIEFLDGARRAKGLEHRIVKNLMHVWHEQRKLGMRTL